MITFSNRHMPRTSPPRRAHRQSYRAGAPVSHHRLMEDIKNKLAKLPSNESSPTFLYAAVLLSCFWPKNRFPEAKNIEEHVDGGWDGKKITMEEWNTNGEYNAIVKVVKDVAERDEV